MAPRPVRGRGGERGPQAADRPSRRPGADGGAVRAGRLRRVPHHAEERQCAGLRRRPLPAPGGRRLLVSAARRSRPRPAGRPGRRRRPAGGAGPAGTRLLPLLVARPHRQGRHACGRHRLSVGPPGLPRPGHRGGGQHQPGQLLDRPRGVHTDPAHPGTETARPPLDRRLGLPAGGGRRSPRHGSHVGRPRAGHQPADRARLRADRLRSGHRVQRVPGAHGSGVGLPGHRHGGPARRVGGAAQGHRHPLGTPGLAAGRGRGRTAEVRASAPASARWTSAS